MSDSKWDSAIQELASKDRAMSNDEFVADISDDMTHAMDVCDAADGGERVRTLIFRLFGRTALMDALLCGVAKEMKL